MGMWVGIGRKARRSYGFDEVSLVPGSLTINPNDVDTSCEIGGIRFQAPIMASSMDGVVDVNFAIAMGKLGGIAVLHLEGVSTRYENPEEAVKKIKTDEIIQFERFGFIRIENYKDEIVGFFTHK